MSDIQTMAAQIMEAINEIDVKLDSLNDSDAATGTRITNQKVKDTEQIWSKISDQLVPQLANLEPDTLVGVYSGLQRAMRDAFQETVKTTVEAEVESAPKVEPLITEDEAAEISSQRSELYQRYKMAATLLEDMEGVKLPMPKMRRGSKGKRGKRAMTLMQWSINGEEVEVDSYKDLALLLGFEKSSELTAFLKAQGVNTTNPENGEVSVSLPDGRALYGEIPSDEDEEEGEDENEEE